jgi:hypothetical protein
LQTFFLGTRFEKSKKGKKEKRIENRGKKAKSKKQKAWGVFRPRQKDRRTEGMKLGVE